MCAMQCVTLLKNCRSLLIFVHGAEQVSHDLHRIIIESTR
ncbi:hypothetical protein EBME_1649 [bacterium endosymbiont of Mortierella elongata FMR23-6]|nr:hypothetical protein EBME_1649 [bacterium endosymbiont of Mortierella elongata FMR23-6]